MTIISADDFDREVDKELEVMKKEGDGCGPGCTCVRPKAVERTFTRLRAEAAQAEV